MKFQLEFDSRVVNDTQFIYEYYNHLQLYDVADLFLKQINKIYDLLEQNPFLFQIYYKDIHCAVVKKFPFLIHYHINEANHSVMVLAIYSTNKKPLWEH